jgi:uncharacterized membrane protein
MTSPAQPGRDGKSGFDGNLQSARSRLPWSVLMVALLSAGLYFRYTGLSEKLYWHDEAYTSLRASGYTAAEMIARVFDGTQKSIDEIQEFQRHNEEKTLGDTVVSLASEDSEHPPLYYLFVRFWMHWFGDSPAAVRSLSVVFALLAFPVLYWLCRELFEMQSAAWLAVALLSLSPFHVLYAQEARQYSLWTLTILSSGAALLRARRRMTKSSWAMYGLVLTAGLYTHLFFVLVLASHIVFTATTEGFRLTRRSALFVWTVLGGLLAFSPWIIIVVADFYRIHVANDWASVNAGWSYLFRLWIFHFASPFVDFDPNGWLGYSLRLTALTLIGYSFYYLFRTGPKEAWTFVLATIAVPAVALILPDLVLGGVRSATGRFLAPCHVGSLLSVSYFLASHIADREARSRRFWRSATIALLLAGAWSCLLISSSNAWWNKDTNRVNAQVVDRINQADRPALFFSDPYPTNLGDVLSLSHLLDSKVRFYLVLGSNLPDRSEAFSDFFLFNPSDALLEELRQRQLQLEAHAPRILWRIAK